jgi:4-hydroxy-3-polyprenylbenzoate decarboxylase
LRLWLELSGTQADKPKAAPTNTTQHLPLSAVCISNRDFFLMAYRSLREAVNDLERNGMLLRIKKEVDPNLEMAEVHRQVYDQGGPALLFEKVKGSPFQAVSNIYGTVQRTEWLFRHTLPKAQKIIELKKDPTALLKAPLRYASAPFTALNALPMKSRWGAPILHANTKIGLLPQVKSWPMDGGAFVTLPQVYTEDPDAPGPMQSNIGMYRIQLSGNDYEQDREIGLHYQLHRGIGVHHTKYNQSDTPFRVTVMVGGPPSHAFSAIMPLPEGLSELTFAGLLGGRRFRYLYQNQHFLSADADFCITGTIVKGLKKPEGPFGDHLGYYSLKHDFPVMRVDKVWHRKDPLWHFTVVGRPPQEDSSFGWLIHQLVKPLTAQEFPGLRDIHAVDAAGVHPLLLAVGSERYMPFREQKPEEILTIANRIIGSGQTSLAKFLIIADGSGDNERLSAHDIPRFFQHVLERIDLRRDLHFHTRTTIDTLDYSGSGWNEGSKLVMAACGKPLRSLGKEIPSNLRLPTGFDHAQIALPGILVLSAKPYRTVADASKEMEALCQGLEGQELANFPLIIVCDDAPFCAATINNFVWTTFTRANPSHDVYGVGAFTAFKHWGCTGPMVIDARIKPHHAPVLVTDPEMEKRAKLILEGVGFGA